MPPPEVGALARALRDALPPEVLFGIGGGTGFGRFAYGEIITLLTRITTTETAKEGFLATICRNLQVSHRLQVATTSDALHKRLTEALAEARTPVVWVEPETLPWPGPPGAYQAVAVTDIDGGTASVFDGQDRQLPLDVLLSATATSGAKHRTLIVDGHIGELSTAIRAGLEAHREQMREGFGPPQTRSSFGLSGLARWTALVAADAKHGETLAAQIENRGGGPAMREAQVAFLSFAGHERAAAVTSAAAGRWAELGSALRGGYAGTNHVRAVHDAEADALAVIEAAARRS
jgi:hypothetical protein